MVHRLAAVGFSAGAGAYELGRPGYPADAVAHLCSRLGIGSASTVVDLAAGTGKLTRELVAVAGRVIAVEPVAAMREALAAAVPSAVAVDGTAEAIPLADASVDAVTVAQAFHWFDGEGALREIRRVLVPSGKLGIVFNARDESVAWVAALGALLDEEASGAPRHKTGAWRAAFDAPDSPFEPLERATFRHEQVLDAESLAARVASISYVAAMPEDERCKLLSAVQRLVVEHGLTAERVVLPYRTDVYWCGPRRSAAGC